MKVYGYGALDNGEQLQPVMFDRAEPASGEVAFDVIYCGICHSDLHQVNNDWGNSQYPCVPGHEIVGRVTAVGDQVTKFKVDDLVGVGCMVDSCLDCEPCHSGNENYCQGPKGCTLTYNGPKIPDGSNTYGGYTTQMVVREEFCLSIPSNLNPECAGPIMCAGITVYSPMKHWNLQPGQTLGVAGIGGLGHMAIKLGKALGATVVALTRNAEKKDDLLGMGADSVVVTEDEEAMADAAQSLDLLINTIPVAHDIQPYISLMKTDSTIVVVGNMIAFPEFSPGELVFNRVGISGSLIGGIEETQEVINLCAEHGIEPAIKLVDIEQVNDVFDTLKNSSSSNYRHVIDMNSFRDKSSSFNSNDAVRLESPSR